jgi:hypothetical protein
MRLGFMVVLGAVFAAVLTSPAAAFDTGPHATITEQALDLAGYSRDVADAVQVANWLTDYYTSSPTFPSAQQCYLEKLHFDDVFTDADVYAYWSTLLRNTLAAAVKAKADNNYVELYTVMGISLHVVQDFYTHSNWVESAGDVGSQYDVTTYLQWSRWRRVRTGVLHTGWYPNCLNIAQGNHTPHGGYSGVGMNHDSVVRPNYARAYVYAVAASYEWIQQIWQAVANAPGDPAFANKAMRYQFSASDRAALSRDQLASLYLSEWIINPANPSSLDGHWNGNRSGFLEAFAATALAWTSGTDSVFVTEFKDDGVYVALTQGLYGPTPPPMPALYAGFMSGTVVDMHAPRVCARHPFGTESYFGQAVATNGVGPGYNGGAAGFPIRDAAQHYLTCTDTPWEYITLVPMWSNSVKLDYTLWNEYGLPEPSATGVPIDGSAQSVTFTCTLRPAYGCRWGDTGASSSQTMPASLNLSGSFYGVTLDRVAIELQPTIEAYGNAAASRRMTPPSP